MLRLFPPLESELMSAPCVIVDCEGRILLWYLPGLMGLESQVNNNSTSKQILDTYYPLTAGGNLGFIGNLGIKACHKKKQHQLEGQC
jgi:hypothetical protein